MKPLLTAIIVCLSIASCTSGTKKDTDSESVKKPAGVTNTGPFDLADLTLTEQDAPGLIASHKVKPEPILDADITPFGYEVFKSSNAAVLRYRGEDLSGTNGTTKNHVLFHYNEKTKILAFYEIELYTQKQADALLRELQKMGKPAYEKLGLEKGAFALDENGNMIEKGKEEKHTFRIWENKKNGLTYFYSETGTGAGFSAELTVLNRSAEYAKEWIKFRSFE